MGYRAYQQLREDLWDYKYKAVLGEADNVLSFSQPDAKDDGPTALDLVQQAAERLLLAGKQKYAAERARGEIIDVLNGKLQDVTKALKQAQLRITAAEDYATAVEFRAQAAELQLSKANRELAAVEQAVRTRLLVS
jgi:hypothetical protein